MSGEFIYLCKLDEIRENQSKGFQIKTVNDYLDIFIVRRGGEIYGYTNSCPHTGVNLDWSPDQFLDVSGELIQCATHGALFRIEDGLCTYGPCCGESLSPVLLRVQDNKIFMVDRSDRKTT